MREREKEGEKIITLLKMCIKWLLYSKMLKRMHEEEEREIAIERERERKRERERESECTNDTI